MCNSHCTYLCLPPSTLHLLLSTLGHASSNPSHRPPASTSDHSPSLSLSLPLPLSLFLSLSLFPPISRILSVGTSASLSLAPFRDICASRSLLLVRFGPEDRRQIDRTIFLEVFLGDDHPATSREIALRTPDSNEEKNSGRSNALSREGKE